MGEGEEEEWGREGGRFILISRASNLVQMGNGLLGKVRLQR